MLRTWILASALLGVVAAGCSNKADEPKTIVKGKLVDGGKPYSFGPKSKGAAAPPPPGAEGAASGLRIQFTPAEGGDTFNAFVDAETGAFEMKGHDGKGIKPGKYKIILGTPMYVPGTPTTNEPFGGKFSREKSQIEREVTLDGPEIVIDVSKPPKG
jgi:hypothetical protein